MSSRSKRRDASSPDKQSSLAPLPPRSDRPHTFGSARPDFPDPQNIIRYGPGAWIIVDRLDKWDWFFLDFLIYAVLPAKSARYKDRR